jgi:hypothetical protein
MGFLQNLFKGRKDPAPSGAPPASPPAHSQISPGSLYSVSRGREGGFGVVKVLKFENNIVHARMYKEKFPTRPATIDPAALSLGSLAEGEFGIGHMPMTLNMFLGWTPVLLAGGSGGVSDEELEGYGEWKTAGGGVFGS